MPAGRPTTYKPEYAQMAKDFCLIGMTDCQLAEHLNISERTLNTWKKQFPEFLQSINEGKFHADIEVVKSLYQQALKGSTLAAMYWMNNRGRIYGWSQKQQVEVHGKHEVNISFKPSGDEPIQEYTPPARKQPDTNFIEEITPLPEPENVPEIIPEVIPENDPKNSPVLWRRIEVNLLG